MSTQQSIQTTAGQITLRLLRPAMIVLLSMALIWLISTS
jgi:hypothetical protein